MTKDVITIDADVAIEEAARIMADEKIGCLPVCDDEQMVGIITDNDLFGIMVDLMGGRRQGIRMTITQPDRAGAIARLTSAIAREKGFMSVFLGYPGSEADVWISVCKVTNLTTDQLIKIVGELDETHLLDIREAIS
jgi:acetoin utilization protein AcuB